MKWAPEVTVSPEFWILGAAVLLLVPLPWACAAAAAAAFHELCHFIAIEALGGKVSALHLGPGGAIMKISHMSTLQELLAAAAGPAGSLLAASLFHFIPRIAVCAGIQGLYNLLPVYPSDGGRILMCISVMLLGQETGEKFCRTVGLITVAGLLLLGLYLTFFRAAGPIPLMIPAGIAWKTKKYLAKNGPRH